MTTQRPIVPIPEQDESVMASEDYDADDPMSYLIGVGILLLLSPIIIPISLIHWFFLGGKNRNKDFDE